MKDQGDGLQRWLEEEEFRFARLDLPGMDNEPVVRVFGPQVLAEETCLFHCGVEKGTDYLERLHDDVQKAMIERRPAPVVR